MLDVLRKLGVTSHSCYSNYMALLQCALCMCPGHMCAMSGNQVVWIEVAAGIPAEGSSLAAIHCSSLQAPGSASRLANSLVGHSDCGCASWPCRTRCIAWA